MPTAEELLIQMGVVPPPPAASASGTAEGQA